MRRLKARLPLGPAVLDPLGPALTDDDRRRMQHPACGAVILFARNFESAAQLQALTEEIHALREPALLIGVDHEGGRVQRFARASPRCRPCAHWAACGIAIARRAGWRRVPRAVMEITKTFTL